MILSGMTEQHIDKKMQTIVIVGASGFIGRHLVAELINKGEFRVRILSRSGTFEHGLPIISPSVEIVKGDLSAPDSLAILIEPSCTVINLAYLGSSGEEENLAAIHNLLDACTTACVHRLIHCSTAVVAGRTRGDQISEADVCNPVTPYAVTKLKIENAVQQAVIDTVILRPTAVFGPGGRNLHKLAYDLTYKGSVQNYVKSCLFSTRRMNLVHVNNVVASILFFIACRENLDGEVFSISDSDVLENNFADVERILRRELNIPNYLLPRFPVSPLILGFLLKFLGQESVNPCADYSNLKLLNRGFQKAMQFEDGLIDYAKWWRSAEQLRNVVA